MRIMKNGIEMVVLISLSGLIWHDLPLPVDFLSFPSQELASNKSNSSSRHNNKNNGHSRISYTLYRGLKLDYVFRLDKEYLICESFKKDVARKPLPQEMERDGIFDFFPRITSDLKIVTVGDSVSMQIAEAMDEAFGTRPENHHQLGHWEYGPIPRRVKYHFNAMTVSSIAGGGIHAAMRFQNLFSPLHEAPPSLMNVTGNPNAPVQFRNSSSMNCGYWYPNKIEELLNYNTNDNDNDNNNNNNMTAATKSNKFDVMIHRVPQGWIGLDPITNESLTTNLELAHKLFGVKTVILLSLEFNNNHFENEHWKTLLEKRELIRNVARNYQPPASGGVETIMVLEMGPYLDQVNEWNARCIGYNTSLPFEDWMLGHRLAKNRPRQNYMKKIAHTCAEIVPDNTPEANCIKNMISYDGMHPCMSTVGGRIVSGLACLMTCAYNSPDDDETSNVDRKKALRECEAQCNDRFMTVKPIPDNYLVDWNASYVSDA